MNARALFSSLSAAALIVALGSRSASAQTFTPINVPGAFETQPHGISGDNIIGEYWDASGIPRGFLYNGSSYTTIDFPGAWTTSLKGISGNNIVGIYTDFSGNPHSFLYDGSAFASIDHPSAAFTGILGRPGGTAVSGISGANIVGTYTDSSEFTHGFVYNGSSYETLDYPYPSGIGDTGLAGISGANILGGYFDRDTGELRSFVYDGSSYRLIPDHPQGHLGVRGISGSSIVGTSFIFHGLPFHGAIYNGSTFLTADVDGALSTIIDGVDGSSFVGYSYSGELTGGSGFVFRSTGVTQDDPAMPIDVSDVPAGIVLQPASPNLPIPDDPAQIGAPSWFRDLCEQSDPFHINIVLELAPGVFVCWHLYDPPMAAGFLYQAANDANFTAVGMPVGLGDFFTVSDGINAPIVLAAGGKYLFPTPVSSFTVTGIHPPVDGADPTAFPTYLSLDQEGAYFAMSPIYVPEASTLLLSGLGLLSIGLATWRHTRRRRA